MQKCTKGHFYTFLVNTGGFYSLQQPKSARRICPQADAKKSATTGLPETASNSETSWSPLVWFQRGVHLQCERHEKAALLSLRFIKNFHSLWGSKKQVATTGWWMSLWKSSQIFFHRCLMIRLVDGNSWAWAFQKHQISALSVPPCKVQTQCWTKCEYCKYTVRYCEHRLFFSELCSSAQGSCPDGELYIQIIPRKVSCGTGGTYRQSIFPTLKINYEYLW